MLEEPLAVPDFSLNDEEGGTFRLSDQRGNVVLLFFGYTQCPDVCPTTVADIAAALRGLSEEEATAMIVAGFIEPIVKELPMEYAVELNRLIELQMEGAVG